MSYLVSLFLSPVGHPVCGQLRKNTCFPITITLCVHKLWGAFFLWQTTHLKLVPTSLRWLMNHHLFHDNNSHWVKLQIKERESMTKKWSLESLCTSYPFELLSVFLAHPKLQGAVLIPPTSPLINLKKWTEWSDETIWILPPRPIIMVGWSRIVISFTGVIAGHC